MSHMFLDLQPMNEEQVAHFRLTASKMYSQTSPHYAEMPFDEAFSLVLNDFNTRLAPYGLGTRGQHFVAILLDGEQVGY